MLAKSSWAVAQRYPVPNASAIYTPKTYLKVGFGTATLQWGHLSESSSMDFLHEEFGQPAYHFFPVSLILLTYTLKVDQSTYFSWRYSTFSNNSFIVAIFSLWSALYFFIWEIDSNSPKPVPKLALLRSWSFNSVILDFKVATKNKLFLYSLILKF